MTELTQTASDPRFRGIAVQRAELSVTSGPDAGLRVRIEGPTFTVGTSPDAHLRLTDPSVSREHFRLELTPEGIVLTDANSKNGVWVGGIKLARALLVETVELDIGRTKLRCALDDATTNLTITEATQFGGAVGHSTAIRHVFAYLAKVAATDVSLLLEGESGVGKEVLAHAVHDESPRAGGPFVPVDCGAIPPHLIESELFGHVKGAFTGAHQSHIGLFEQADGGTLFLDEIGELPIDMQPKLLRALEQRQVRPVGGSATRPLDLRIVSATNRSLTQRISEGLFREDLYYRVAVARVRVPSLREREVDIAPLANAFLRQVRGNPSAEVERGVLAMFRGYDWPGNVRELRNAIGRYALLGARERAELLPSAERGLGDRRTSALPFHEARRQTIEQFEREYLEAVLERAGGNVSRAAELAGISRSSYYRMLERIGGSATET